MFFFIFNTKIVGCTVVNTNTETIHDLHVSLIIKRNKNVLLLSKTISIFHERTVSIPHPTPKHVSILQLQYYSNRRQCHLMWAECWNKPPLQYKQIHPWGDVSVACSRSLRREEERCHHTNASVARLYEPWLHFLRGFRGQHMRVWVLSILIPVCYSK